MTIEWSSTAKIISDLLKYTDQWNEGGMKEAAEAARAWLKEYEESQKPPRYVTIPDVSDIPANSPKGPTGPNDLWRVYGEDGDDLLLEVKGRTTHGHIFLVFLGDGPSGGMTIRLPKNRVKEWDGREA